MNKTSIEWCNRPETRGPAGAMTWNPIRARLKRGIPPRHAHHSGTFCTRISPGCTNCYASVINKRFGNGLEFTVPNLEKIEFFVDERILEQPLRQKKPCTIFAGDMNDLFHESIPFPMIAEVLTVACDAKWHTFQFLTKRTDRMREFFAAWHSMTRDFGPLYPHMWPQPHVWLGVSVEDQQRADERIPLLRQTPAAVRFLSVEPLLEAVNLYLTPNEALCDRLHHMHTLEAGCWNPIQWVICGGESGPGARPFNLDWAESLLGQCRAAGVPFFCKQLGSHPQVHSCRNEVCTHPDCGMEDIHLKDRKGGNPAEWPESLRVREFPASQKAEVVSA